MTIRRLTAAVALGAFLLVGAPAAASATSTECTPPGGLVGVSIDDCGINASLLGIDVSLDGSESGSGDETPDEPAAPDDPPDTDDPQAGGSGGDSGSGSGGSGGGGGSTSSPSPSSPWPSVPADVPTHGAYSSGTATGSPDDWAEARTADQESTTGQESTSTAATEAPTGATGPAGGGPADGAGPGQVRGPLSDIPVGSQAVGPLTHGPAVVVALTLIAAGVFSAITAVSLSVRKQITPSAS